MQKTAVILMGLQASGKSTFYKNNLSQFVHVNLDTLRSRKNERILLDDCLQKGLNFAVDNTNPTYEDRARYIIPAKQNGYKIVGYYFQSQIKACIQRNALRQGKQCVPETAIASTSNKLQLPRYEEGFDELYFVKIQENDFIVTRWVQEDQIG